MNQVRKDRNSRKVTEALDELHRNAEDGSTNLMPIILSAVKEYATVGEICSVLQEIYGEYRPLTIF